MENMRQMQISVNVNNNANEQIREFISGLMEQFGEMVMPQHNNGGEVNQALKVIAKEVIKNSEPEVAQFAECEPIVEMMGQSLALMISKLKVMPIKAPNGMIIGLGGITER